MMREKTKMALVYGFCILVWLAALLVAAFAAPAKRDNTQRLLNRALTAQHPNGKGPSSTSAARGYYKGGNGQWKSR